MHCELDFVQGTYKLSFSEGFNSRFPLYVVLVAFILFLGIYSTELVFGAPIHQLMLKISKGSALIYGVIMTTEALILALFQFKFIRLVQGRLSISKRAE